MKNEHDENERPTPVIRGRRGGEPRSEPRARAAAFTLVELLCVVAVVGILAALIFPSVGGAKRSANVARTKVQFAQWAAAIEAFRGEYGYYPALGAGGLVNGGVTAEEHRFHDVLSGRRRDGTATVAGGIAAAQNRKAIRFHTFASSELNAAGLVCDAFENTEIAVLVDRDLDGTIRAGDDYASLPPVGGIAPAPSEMPPGGIRAGVAFYAPAPTATAANPEFIFSWK